MADNVPYRYELDDRWSRPADLPPDSDFKIPAGGMLKFGIPEEPNNNCSLQADAVDNETPPASPYDPTPWMRCCGRNFMYSIFSERLHPPPHRGYGRGRRNNQNDLTRK